MLTKLSGRSFFLSYSQSTILISVIYLTSFFFSITILLVQKIRSLQIFSVKSSWEFHWMIMFQKDVVCASRLSILATSQVELAFEDPDWLSFLRSLVVNRSKLKTDQKWMSLFKWLEPWWSLSTWRRNIFTNKNIPDDCIFWRRQKLLFKYKGYDN